MTTIYVSPSGKDSNTGLENSAPLQTIQEALKRSQPGDVIQLAGGDYPENVDVRVPRLTWELAEAAAPARLQMIDIEAEGNRFTGLHFGLPTSASFLVRLNRGAHETVMEDCVFDSHDIEICRPVLFRVPSTKPFGDDAASRCRILRCKFTRGRMISMLDLFGDDNVVEECHFSDGANVDWIRCHGRRNTVRNCRFERSYQVPGGNHPDFFQCFSDPQRDGMGWGSYGHLVEGNIAVDCPNMQITQMSNMGRLPRDQHGNITFRNNLFVGFGLSASCTIPDVHYYNNTFIRCNFVNESAVLSFGARGYEGREVASGSIQPGLSYRVFSANGEGTILYDGQEMNRRTQFYGVAGSTSYSATGDAVVVEFPLTFAHGAQVVGNIFLHCGSPNRLTSGWYAVDPILEGVLFDRNYVAKEGVNGEPFQPLREGTKPVGSPGWGTDDSYRWFEPNGVNGGDPGMVDFAGGDFRLRPDSVLAGIVPGQYSGGLDLLGLGRPDPGSIGAYEALPVSGPVDPPPVEDPIDLVVVTKVRKSGAAESETHRPPFTLEVK